MNKKIVSIVLAVFVLALVLTGCGASSHSGKTDLAYPAEAAPMPAAPDYNYASDSSYDYDMPDSVSGGSIVGELTEGLVNSNTSFDKIIYTSDVELETLEFDQTITDLYDLIERNGAFIESSSISGTGYNTKYYGSVWRSARFSIRVPRENFAGMTGSLASIGNVTYSTTSADNITASFLDTESRLKAYRTEETSLLEMLEKAETVEDMITVQDRLSWVRYEIESLTSTLNNWQNEVDYSTINLNINEVKKYTEEPVLPKTFGEEIREGFTSSVSWLKQALRDVIVFLASAAPVLVLPIIILLPAGIIALIIVLCVRGKKKKNRKQD